MGLFGFGKRKEEEKQPVCCCGEVTEGICCVRVLGSGCGNCRALLASVREALRSMGLDVEVDNVTDMERIAGYGVMSMPALVVNEKVVSAGKVLKREDVESILRTFVR